MRGTSRVTISLPTPLLEAVEQTLLKGEESRSALVRRLLELRLQRPPNEVSLKRTSRVTVSLPALLLEAIDQTLVKGEENRSALVRHLLEEALREAKEGDDVAKWIQSYQEHPQTEDELEWTEASALNNRAEQPRN